ncbi:L-histidine N(alpha)-methyltransferase [Rivibacter subsaxonicus]|uniref:Dimethylhistidine N-methyltransferase n=1 Tax=Rivibacter subsaxonicus TaxID=457575 RepID=A0A4Q7VD69_9BURK|nr:L-histidine N(alpha)-methyltransferase [Rivibacter subsaxonicus]RZT93640.1 dimethylhistidine N-methyltransferase [Rivibacter subsaxonicus]
MKQALDTRTTASEFGRELLAGLERRPRSVPPKFFYDAAGSALFDRICELPEYYPTRTELRILADHAPEIARCIGPHADIIEFGAGSSRKVRLLLEALQQPRRFVPIDISAEHLHAAADLLRLEHPGLLVQPLAADFTRPFDLPALPPGPGPVRRVGFFPGSSIGNFSPDEALHFLRDAAALLRGSAVPGGMLVGVDLVKDAGLLHAAYNDAAGVTAAFNLNLLARANRELGADFELDGFEHYAFYEPRLQRVEMHLLSRRAQRVHLAGQAFDFAAGQGLHTENSYKYGVDGFRELAARAGFVPGPVWCDARRWFSLHWLGL